MSSPQETTPRQWRQALPHALLRLCGSVVSGALIYVSYEPLGLWQGAILGLAVWYLILQGVSLAAGALYTVICVAVTYLLLLPWVGEFVGAPPFLALCVYLSLWAIPLGMIGAAGRRLPRWQAPITVAAGFVALEWARSSFPYGGFAWVRLAWGQVDGPLASLVSVGGPALVTAATALVAFLLAESFSRNFWKSWLPIGCAAVIVLSGVVIGALPKADPVGEITVAAVQGNVPRMGLDFNAQRKAVLANHVEETERIKEKVDVIIWPENAADVNPMTDTAAGALVTRALRQVQTPIAIGTLTRDSAGEHNTVAIFNPDSTVGDMHHKKYLQPFGEYMPMRDFLRKLTPLVDEAGDFKPGNDDGVLRVAGTRLGVSTCYEVAFNASGRDAVRGGAEIMATPTNNATFGFTNMTYQQLAMSRLRALELDRAVVVAATSGVSAIITPDGKIRSQTEIFKPDHLIARLPLKDSRTLSVRCGDWIEWAMVMIGVICSFHALRRYRAARLAPGAC